MTNQEYLKEHSRLHHQRTEDAFDLKSLCRKKETYIGVLKAFSGFYLVQEELIKNVQDELQSIGILFSEKSKLPLLREDLNHFGEVPLDQGPVLKAIDNLPGAMGVLYVLEGSTLGGQVIHNALFKAGLIDESGKGGRFFNPYGTETIPKWNQFKTILNSLAEEHRGDMLKSATYTFEALEHWLKQQLHR